jgi:hypothetical protein
MQRFTAFYRLKGDINQRRYTIGEFRNAPAVIMRIALFGDESQQQRGR